MDLKTATIGVRTIPTDKALFMVYCSQRGKTVSEVIDEDLIQKAVQPLKAALAGGEMQDGPDAA
jgi:hypothetical protein